MGYVIERKKKIGKKWFGPILGKIYMPLWWWVCFGFLHDCEDKRVPGVNCGQAWLLGLVTCTRVTSISIPLVLVLCHIEGRQTFWSSILLRHTSNWSMQCSCSVSATTFKLGIWKLLAVWVLIHRCEGWASWRETNRKQAEALPSQNLPPPRVSAGKRERGGRGNSLRCGGRLHKPCFMQYPFPLHSLHPFGSLPSGGKWLA